MKLLAQAAKVAFSGVKALVSSPSTGGLVDKTFQAIDDFTESPDERRALLEKVLPRLWDAVQKDAMRGIWFTRLWNQAIRPMGATLALSYLFRWGWGDLFGWPPLTLPEIPSPWLYLLGGILGAFFWLRGNAKKGGVG